MKKNVKRVLLSLGALCLFVAVVCGAIYAREDGSGIYIPEVTFNAQQMPLEKMEWNVPVLFSLVHKPISQIYQQIEDVWVFTNPEFALDVPEGYHARAQLVKDGETLFSGTAEDLANFSLEENGGYFLTVFLTKERDGKNGYGTLTFSKTIVFEIEPALTLSATTAQQGEIITVNVSGLLGGDVPTGTGDIGALNFFKTPAGYSAYIPIAYNRGAGTYNISVQAGGVSFSETFTVTTREFEVQYMEISQDVYDNTAGSAAASAEYRAAIYPLYEIAHEQQYWQGAFTQPVQARVSTEYGLFRYVNGVLNERHSGIDLAADGGTPILAPANGVVLYSGYLQLSGNTIVVEHGGGMKSMFFHMSERMVEQGDTITQNDIIGLVGTTGYSTGNHLHYEVKIGSQSINPWLLFSAESAVFDVAV